ncbi:hypothetical protein CXB51_020004 [Gossypium anomalum]|uniref:CCHC-type domain-containing protein n=1 Tax=Gossypium anomalum TaxID=47600 RepID=A0A8J6CWY2_9ROSI|nr:hypothetical protein CXB51_020004 [Gossypium anomalum]
MARQFGNFLRKFLDYDTSIPFLGSKTYMRIRVRLDVTTPLKRKKKIQVGGDLIVCARFKYEKLSLFCFICGKLGHSESYCPFRLRIEQSKIVFRWDLSLHVIPRRRSTVMSGWLYEADGSQCQDDNLRSSNQSNIINWEIDSGRNIRRNFRDKMSNPNLIPLGSNQYYSIKRNNSGSNMGNSTSVVDGLENGPIEMVLEEENDPLTAAEGKKRQRIVIDPNTHLGLNVECGSLDLTARSGEQSSRSQ